MSDLARNSEDRFSCVQQYIMGTIQVKEAIYFELLLVYVSKDLWIR